MAKALADTNRKTTAVRMARPVSALRPGETALREHRREAGEDSGEDGLEFPGFHDGLRFVLAFLPLAFAGEQALRG
jgi:hypothetical protein